MASTDSIKRARLRPGHFLSMHSDRLLYVSPVRSLGGFSVLLELAAIGWPQNCAEHLTRPWTPRKMEEKNNERRNPSTRCEVCSA